MTIEKDDPMRVGDEDYRLKDYDWNDLEDPCDVYKDKVEREDSLADYCGNLAEDCKAAMGARETLTEVFKSWGYLK
jgi:hypothetical protein